MSRRKSPVAEADARDASGPTFQVFATRGSTIAALAVKDSHAEEARKRPYHPHPQFDEDDVRAAVATVSKRFDMDLSVSEEVAGSVIWGLRRAMGAI